MSATTPQWLRVSVLGLLVVQNTSLRLVMKHARTTSPNFSATAAVFCGEVLKFCVAFTLLAKARGSVLEAARDVLAPRELLRLSPPAALYCLSDRLHHVSVRRLDVAAFQVLSQMKVLTAALFGKVFRGRDVAGSQWLALLVLAFGIAVCQVGDLGGVELEAPDPIGFLTITTTSFLGAGAGTYTEAVLKRGTGDGVLWKRAAQMAFLGSFIAAGPAATASFDGFTAPVWGVVALNAAGGLLVAAAMRYADNVLKTLAASLSIVVSAVAATVVLGAPPPSASFSFGGVCVVSAIYVYGTASKPQAKLSPIAPGDKAGDGKPSPPVQLQRA